MALAEAISHSRNLIAACAAITVFGFAFGVTYPLLSLILEGRQVSSDLIGINAAMTPLGILLFSPVIPIAARRFGARNVALAAALATVFLIPAFKLFDSLEAWFFLRFVQGMTISTLFVLSEVWIVQFAGDQHRGRVVAIYGAVLSASFGAGPAVVGWIGVEGWLPFLIASGVLLLGMVPLLLVEDELREKPHAVRLAGFFDFAAKAPVLLMAVAAFAILDAATLSFLPIYGIRNGLDLMTSANLLTALIVGNVVLQFPIGWMADKFPKRLVLALCAAVTVACLLMLPSVMGTWAMWPVIVFAGAAGYGVYTIALASLGDRFSGHELVTGSSAFAVMWGIGALFGAVIAGSAMSQWGPHGLPMTLAVIYGCLVVGVIVRAKQIRAGL